MTTLISPLSLPPLWKIKNHLKSAETPQIRGIVEKAENRLSFDSIGFSP